MPLNLILDLYTLLAKPKVGVATLAISLRILLITAGIIKSTRNPQPLQYEVEADKTVLKTSSIL